MNDSASAIPYIRLGLASAPCLYVCRGFRGWPDQLSYRVRVPQLVQQVSSASNGLAVFPRIALGNDYGCAESSCPHRGGRRREFGSLERKQGVRAGPIFPFFSRNILWVRAQAFGPPSFEPGCSEPGSILTTRGSYASIIATIALNIWNESNHSTVFP